MLLCITSPLCLFYPLLFRKAVKTCSFLCEYSEFQAQIFLSDGNVLSEEFYNYEESLFVCLFKKKDETKQSYRK